LPANLHVSFGHVKAEAMLIALKNDVALSTGSACTSANLGPSHVLKALGRPDDEADGSLRFGLGRFNTEEEVDQVVRRIIEVVQQLRAVSPTWQMRHAAAPS
jgi:cysteine desulfurase